MNWLYYFFLAPLGPTVFFSGLDIGFNQNSNHFFKTIAINLLFCYLISYSLGIVGVFICHPTFPHFMRKFSYPIVALIALPLIYFLLIKLESFLGISTNYPIIIRSAKILIILATHKLVYYVLLSQFG